MQTHGSLLVSVAQPAFSWAFDSVSLPEGLPTSELFSWTSVPGWRVGRSISSLPSWGRMGWGISQPFSLGWQLSTLRNARTSMDSLKFSSSWVLEVGVAGPDHTPLNKSCRYVLISSSLECGGSETLLPAVLHFGALAEILRLWGKPH